MRSPKLLRPGRFVGTAAFLLCLAGFAWAAALHDGGPSERIVTAAQTTPGGGGACDVDGVRVAYASQFAPSEYRVEQVTVRDLSPTCANAQVTVKLRDQAGQDLPSGSGQATVPSSGPSSVVVALTNGPRARAVFNVDVDLAGGQTPRPTGCTVNKFELTYVGELTADAITGTNKADLIYGLAGDDRIDSLNGTDCLVGGDGNDVITGGNHNSFVDGGAGTDQITLGNANNTVLTGAGADQVRVGNGDNRITVGTGQNTVTMGTGKNVVTVVGGSSNTACILPKSSKTTNANLTGCKTITRTP